MKKILIILLFLLSAITFSKTYDLNKLKNVYFLPYEVYYTNHDKLDAIKFDNKRIVNLGATALNTQRKDYNNKSFSTTLYGLNFLYYNKKNSSQSGIYLQGLTGKLEKYKLYSNDGILYQNIDIPIYNFSLIIPYNYEFYGLSIGFDLSAVGSYISLSNEFLKNNSNYSYYSPAWSVLQGNRLYLGYDYKTEISKVVLKIGGRVSLDALLKLNDFNEYQNEYSYTVQTSSSASSSGIMSYFNRVLDVEKRLSLTAKLNFSIGYSDIFLFNVFGKYTRQLYDTYMFDLRYNDTSEYLYNTNDKTPYQMPLDNYELGLDLSAKILFIRLLGQYTYDFKGTHNAQLGVGFVF